MAPLLFSLGRWRPGHLLLAWGTYWIGLIAATLGPAIPAVLRATSEDSKGNMSISAGNGLRFLVTESGETLWSLTASVSGAMLWIVGPPLVLWAAWLFRRRRARDAAIDATARFAELPHARAADIPVDRSARERVDRQGDSGP